MPLALLLALAPAGSLIAQTAEPPGPARLAAAGIRVLTGRHLILYTDVAADPAVDELPGVFDAAVPQWCEYFGIPPDQVGGWRMSGCLMRQSARFSGVGLLPADLPPFLHGYQRGDQLWWNEQPTEYYRRHLLLHEGTHAFMKRWLGGAGPPWYMEGTAELLGTHRWQHGQLELGVFPATKEDTPGWGRIKIVRDELAAGRGMLLTRIMGYDQRAHLRNEPYGWCWAATAFLDRHPATQAAFRELRNQVADDSLDFSRRFVERLAPAWSAVQHDWQLFVLELDYGYDVPRMAIDARPVRDVPADGALVRVAADRGWQSSGLRLEAGRTYRITASGRYQVHHLPEPWWCEPGGVTIRYVSGRPLGMLLAAVRDEQQARPGLSPLAAPQPIGLDHAWQIPEGGTLYLKINDSPSGLADNAGQLTVRVVPQ